MISPLLMAGEKPSLLKGKAFQAMLLFSRTHGDCSKRRQSLGNRLFSSVKQATGSQSGLKLTLMMLPAVVCRQTQSMLCSSVMGWNTLPTFTVTWFPSVSMTGTCFSVAPSEVLGSNTSKGFKLSGSAALGVPVMASRMDRYGFCRLKIQVRSSWGSSSHIFFF